MNEKIYIRKTSKIGRGIFAKSSIKKGRIVEICPVIVVPTKDRKYIDKTFLYNYYFMWGTRNQPAIALGYGSLYNHSYQPNADYDQNIKKKIIVFKAIKDIQKNEEITVNYNGDPDSKAKLWFKPI